MELDAAVVQHLLRYGGVSTRYLKFQIRRSQAVPSVINSILDVRIRRYDNKRIMNKSVVVAISPMLIAISIIISIAIALSNTIFSEDSKICFEQF